MKNLKAPFLVIVLLFLNVLLATPKHKLPQPQASVMSDDGSEPNDDECIVCNGTAPGFPIDQNITFLLVSGLVLGTAVVYKNRIKKASV